MVARTVQSRRRMSPEAREALGLEGSCPPLSNRGGGTRPEWSPNELSGTFLARIDRLHVAVRHELTDDITGELANRLTRDGWGGHLKYGEDEQGGRFASIRKVWMQNEQGEEVEGSLTIKRGLKGTQHKRFGEQAVYLEAGGWASAFLAEAIMETVVDPDDAQASRLDFAMDFTAEVSPWDLFVHPDRWSSNDKGFTLYGNTATGTVYLFRGSDYWMLRAYRKDFEKDGWTGGPTMRLESQWGDRKANAVFNVFRQKGNEGLTAVMREELKRRAGMVLPGGESLHVASQKRQQCGLPRTTANLIATYSDVIKILRRHGITIDDLERSCAFWDDPSQSRNQKARERQRQWKGTRNELRAAIEAEVKAARLRRK